MNVKAVHGYSRHQPGNVCSYIEGEAHGVVVVCGIRSLQCFIDNELYLDRKIGNRTSVCGIFTTKP